MHEDLYKLLHRRWKARDKTNAWVFPNPATGNPYHKNSRFVKNLFDRVCARARVKRFTAHYIDAFDTNSQRSDNSADNSRSTK
jgi:hypothetical protein